MRKRRDTNLPVTIDNAALPAFPLRESEVVRFAPNKEPIRARLTLAQDLHFYLTACALSYSERTVEHYGRDLRDFERIVSNQYGQPIPSAAVNVPALQFYLHELRKRGVSDATYDRHFRSVRAFFQFRFAMRDLPNEMEHIQPPKSRPRPMPVILSIADACRLCDLDADDRTPQGLRDGAIVETLYACGLRVAELVGLRWKDLDAPGGLVFVRNGKGAKDRLVPIGRKAIRKLRSWRAWLAPETDHPIFPSFLNRHLILQRTRHVSTRAVEYIVADRAKRAGITLPITPHTLRHCFVTHLIERGADSLSVRAMVGHANLSTTTLYAHLDSVFMIAQARHGRGWSRSAA
jgi:site-specific recombinase XerD